MSSEGSDVPSDTARTYGTGSEEELSHEALVTKWEQFIKRYTIKNQETILKQHLISADYHGYYFNLVNHMQISNKTLLVIDYHHIEDAIYDRGLTDKQGNTFMGIKKELIQDPEGCIKGLRAAAYNMLVEIHPEYAKELTHTFRAVITNVPNTKEITSIAHDDIGRLITTEGFVTSVEERRSLDTKVAYVCANGHVNEAKTKGFRHDKPTICYGCDSKKFERSKEDSSTDTFQEIRLQQRHDRSDPGKIVNDMRIILVGKDLVDQVKGGDLAEVTGFVRTEDDSTPSRNSLSNFYIEALYIAQKKDEYLVQTQILNQEKIKNAVNPANEDDGYERMKASIAPSVLSHEIIKESILLMMAGCDARKLSDTQRFRGDLQILLLGDPSTAKTSLAEFAYKMFPRAIYMSGQVTEAGFTAAVDYVDGVATLKAGAYLLASGNLGGLVVADEITRTEKSARRVLASIMDNKQIVSIQKGPIHKEMRVKASSLHMGNPVGQENWDDSKSLVDNTSLEPWLLSRYDLIYVVRDIPDVDSDSRKARHYLDELADSVLESELEDSSGTPESIDARARLVEAAERRDVFTIEEMQAIAVYMKQFKPKIEKHSEAFKILYDFYLKTRKMHGELKKLAEDALAGDEESYSRFQDSRSLIPSRITMRDLGAAARLALASARAHFRSHVTIKDAQIAINLLEVSMVESGYNPLVGFSEEKQKREYTLQKKQQEAKLVEEHKRKNLQTLEYARQQKANKKKIENKWKQDLRTFRAVLARNAFTRCIDCHGAGSISTGLANGPYEQCGSCDGKGLFPQPFTESAIREIAVGMGNVHHVDFDIIWNEFLNTSKITQGETEGFWTYQGTYDDLKGVFKDNQIDTILQYLVSPSKQDYIPEPPPDESPENRFERLLREAKEHRS